MFPEEQPRDPADIPDPRDPWTRWGGARILLLTVALGALNVGAQGVGYGMTGNLFFAVGIGGTAVILAARLLAASRGLDTGVVFHLNRPGWAVAGWSVLAALACQVPVGLLAAWSARIRPPTEEWIAFFNDHLPVGPLETGLAFSCAVVLGPLAEEIVFRGLLYRLFRRSWGVMPSAVLSALAFGLAHGEPWYLFGLVGLGIVLALVYEATGSLTAAAVVHAAHNAVNVTLMVTDGGLTSELPDGPMPWGWLAASLALLALSLRRLVARRN